MQLGLHENYSRAKAEEEARQEMIKLQESNLKA